MSSSSTPDSLKGKNSGKTGKTFSATMKERVREYLETHPTSKYTVDYGQLALELGLDPHVKRNYLYKLVSEARTLLEIGLGLKCPKFHGWHGFIYSLVDMKRELVKGWVESKGKNRCYIYRDSLGRLEWFETGRINVWVRRPVSEGKKVQLLANGFYKTDLILDIKVFAEWVKTLKMKGVHCVVDTGLALPYTKIDLFGESNGVVLVLGDKSHRTGAELRVNLPDWAERFELQQRQNVQALENLTGFLKELSTPKGSGSTDKNMIV